MKHNIIVLPERTPFLLSESCCSNISAKEGKRSSVSAGFERKAVRVNGKVLSKYPSYYGTR